MTIAEIQDRLVEINSESESIIAAAQAEKRDLSGDEQQQLDSLIDEFKTKKADAGRLEAIASQAAMLNGTAGRKSPSEQPRAASDEVDDDDETPSPAMRPAMAKRGEPNIVVRTDRQRWGWRHFGEFAAAVRGGCIPGGHVDQRLAAQMAAPTTYGSEGVGVDGGFAVPPDFRQDIMRKVLGEDTLIGRTDQFVSSSNNITFPKDETTPWQTSGGVQAYWEGEGNAITQSKIAIEQETIKLNKLTCLVPVTDELIEDTPALDMYLRRKAPEKMNFKINLAIVQGDGVGKPLGILNAPSLVSVAKETSQPGDTIMAKNIFKMYSRMYGPLRSEAVWLINQDIEPELFSMTIPVKNVAGTENVGGSVVYLPANGLSSSPYGTLMGRPVIPTQACETVGDKGDILFVHLPSYMTALKTGGIRLDTSIHLFFDANATAFRFIFRMAGRPWWSAAITPRDGSNSLSWAVSLDDRT